MANPQKRTAQERPRAEVLKWFVNRAGERARFARALAGKSPVQVFVIEGNEGIGKTSLLKQFRAQAIKQQIPTAFCDFARNELNQVVDLLQYYSILLGSHNFSTLKAVLEEGTQLKIILKREKNAKPGRVEIQGKRVTIRNSDIAGGDIIKNNVFNLGARDPGLQKIWLGKLNEAFFTDLKKILKRKKHLVLLVDSVERISPAIQQWLFDQLFSRINRREPGESGWELQGLIIALAGERVPQLELDWDELVTKLHLDPFPAREVRKYLTTHRGLKISEKILQSIYELTQGGPYLVAIIADNPVELSQDVDRSRLLEILVTGILHSQTSDMEVVDTLLLASVSDWCDQSLLDVLSKVANSKPARLSKILRFSFVALEENRLDGRIRINGAVRDILRKELLRQPEKWQRLQRAAAQYFDQKAKDAQGFDIQEYRSCEALAVFHTLMVDGPAGKMRLLKNFFMAEKTYDLTFSNQMLSLMREIPNLSQEMQDWLLFLDGRLALIGNDFGRSQNLLSRLLEQPLSDLELRGLANQALGESLTALGSWKDALRCLEKAYTILSKMEMPATLGQLYLALGNLYLVQARAMGELVQPVISGRHLSGWQKMQTILVILVSLPMQVFVWAGSRLRLLSPLGVLMDYRNWRLVQLLLSALNWFRLARTTFVRIDDHESEWIARKNIATVYYCLGARQLGLTELNQLLGEPLVNNYPYRLAQVNQALAEALLAPGYNNDDLEKAQDGIREAISTFNKMGDQQAEAEARKIKGRASLLQGEIRSGLDEVIACLDIFDSIQDRLGAGKALDELREWVQQENGVSDRQQVLDLITNRKQKTYLFRVPDRMVLLLQVIIIAGMLLVFLNLVTWVGLALLTPLPELLDLLRTPGVYVRAFIKIMSLCWTILVLYAFSSLVLVLLGTRRQLKTERLGGITTDPEGIYRINYQNEETKHLLWQEIHTFVSVETRVPKKPLTLLSWQYLCAGGGPLIVPATMLWYEALKEDIQQHLEGNIIPVVRQNWNLIIPGRWMLSLLVAGSFCLNLSQFIILNQQPFPISTAVAVAVTPILRHFGLLLTLIGPYWWLIFGPLRTSEYLSPASRLPWLAGLIGLGIVGMAFYLDAYQPYFPIRNWLDETLHPLGFLLVGYAFIWLIRSRHWKEFPIHRGAHVYTVAIRLAAAAGMLVLVWLSGLFAWRQLFPYFFINQGITQFYHGAYLKTIDNMSRALIMNSNLADGYMFRALAHGKLGHHTEALRDLTQLVNRPSEKMAYYYYYRAQTLNEVGRVQAACADLQTAFSKQRWKLSPGFHQRAQDFWQKWACAPP